MRILLPVLLGLVCLLLARPARAQTPVVSGTLSVSLTGDANSNGKANPGDQLSFTAVITNTNSATATGVNLTLPAPTNTSLVTGSLKTSTLARPDAYTTLISGSLSGSSVLTNDFGLPTKTVISFGPSASPASTLANGSNSSPSDAGGTVVMNPDGAFSYSPTGSFVGYDKFGYTATTFTPPNDAATVTIRVGTPITALPNAYTITGNVSNTQLAGTGLLANDTGDQPVVSAVNGNTANVGLAVTTAQSGTVIVQANGTFVYSPPAGYEGPDSFTYTANNGLNLASSAVVTLTIQGMIWFINNTAAAGGTGTLAKPFNSLAGFAALNNGTGNNPAPGDAIFLYSGSGNYTGGLTLLANQKLIGQGATASLSTVAGISPAPGSAALPATGGASPVLVNGGGSGLTLGPTNLLRGFNLGNASANALSGNGFGTLTVSEVSISTTGQALALSTGTVNGSFPSISSSGGANNVSLTAVAGSFSISAGTLSGASSTAFNVTGGTVGITYSGNLSQASNAPTVSVSAHSGGALLFQSGTLAASNGTGLQFDNADGSYTFRGPTTLNGGDAGIDIVNGSSGTFSFSSSTSINNPSGVPYREDASTPTVTYNGGIRKDNNANTAVDINAKTGGTTTFGGTFTISTGTANAIDLTGNTNSTVTFGGGNLGITTTSGVGFNATGGGTVNVTGSGNTINSPTGTALNVVNTTIGASGLTFQSISSASSAGPNGIILNTTGNLGGLTVTGTGSAGSGGTIANKTGSDGSTTQGTGIYLNSTSGVSLTRMQLNNFQNFGIKGTGVTGFSLSNSTINGTNGTTNAGGSEEGSIRFDGLFTSGSFPTASITNCTISGGYTQNVLVLNTSGTLNRLMMTNNTFGLIGTTAGNDNVDITARVSAILNVTCNDNQFLGTRADFFECIADNNSVMDVVCRQNKFTDGQAIISGGGVGVSIRGDNAGTACTMTFDVSCNRLVGGSGSNSHDVVGMFIAKGNGAGSFSGTVNNNVIGPAKANSNADGLFVRSAGSGTITILIQNNSVNGYSSSAIHLQNNDGSCTMNATVYGNTVSAPQGFAFSGLFVDNGATATDASVTNLVVGSASNAAQKNDFSAGDPFNFTDVSLSNFNAVTKFNLSKNGSGSSTAAGVIDDDNLNPATTNTDTSGGVGTITLVTTLPVTPAAVVTSCTIPN